MLPKVRGQTMLPVLTAWMFISISRLRPGIRTELAHSFAERVLALAGWPRWPFRSLGP